MNEEEENVEGNLTFHTLYGTPGLYFNSGEEVVSAKDIEQDLRALKLGDVLAECARMSLTLFKSDKSYLDTGGAPIADVVLAYIAAKAVLSSDVEGASVRWQDLEPIARKWFALPEPNDGNTIPGLGTLIRNAVAFEYQISVQYALARTLMIYGECWQASEKSRRYDVATAILQATNVGLDTLLVFANIWVPRFDRGAIYRAHLRTLELSDGNTLTKRDAEKVFDFLGTSYRGFLRKLLNSLSAPDIQYEKYRPNPLFEKPVLTPNWLDHSGSPVYYLAPIPRLIIDRCTRGLYHALADLHKNLRHNPFKAAFGHAFEVYINRLIKGSIDSAYVEGERTYTKNRSHTFNPDAIVKRPSDLVFIQAKQAGLYLNAKSYGRYEDVLWSLQRSIADAICQFWEFEADIASGKHSELEDLREYVSVRRLVVTHDEVSYANTDLMRMAIFQAIKQINIARSTDGLSSYEVPPDYQFQVCSITEFEQAVSSGVPLFDLLTEKLSTEETALMDLGVFIRTKKYPVDNVLLQSATQEFLDRKRVVKVG